MFGFGFDFMYLLFIAPALLLAMLAQWMVRSAYQQMSQVRASMSGYEAARRILDAGGLHAVDIEQIPGQLSDHYDPSGKILRLSPEVFSGHSMASVGIAAHEAGHALQDARGYAPLRIRNLAVPAAQFGSSFGTILLMIGMVAFIVDVPKGFTEAATVLPVQIFLWSDLPEVAFQSRTAAAIIVLLVILFCLNAVAIYMRKRFERRW